MDFASVILFFWGKKGIRLWLAGGINVQGSFILRQTICNEVSNFLDQTQRSMSLIWEVCNKRALQSGGRSTTTFREQTSIHFQFSSQLWFNIQGDRKGDNSCHVADKPHKEEEGAYKEPMTSLKQAVPSPQEVDSCPICVVAGTRQQIPP